ncbi:MAG: cytochrome-c peroxidase [Bacteroidetes bacterium B1(2017)]|nr:MAG: cytochrome-c peroxidase [Bacteroidetes bacterium B1(2017)]
MRSKKLVFILVLLTCFGFVTQTPYVLVEPIGWPKPVYNFKRNPLNSETILLGRALFYDPILSKNNSISCASCHSQYNAFTHADHALSHGIYDSIGTRNSPTLMNLAWHKSFMWDGAINHLDMQALAPITHPKEMGENMASLLRKLNQSKFYKPLFLHAYGDTLVNSERLLKALSQFMLTLVSSNSKYDSVMRKERVFTAQEQNGYSLFKQHCNSCHTEPLFTNLEFENNGLCVNPNLIDLGRFRLTLNPKDSFKFKVPSLRNIEFSFPYMHDGRFKTIAEVLAHYMSPKCKTSTLAKKLQSPINLTKAERVDLTAFLLCLTDKTFLFNEKYSYPKRLFFPMTKD